MTKLALFLMLAVAPLGAQRLESSGIDAARYAARAARQQGRDAEEKPISTLAVTGFITAGAIGGMVWAALRECEGLECATLLAFGITAEVHGVPLAVHLANRMRGSWREGMWISYFVLAGFTLGGVALDNEFDDPAVWLAVIPAMLVTQVAGVVWSERRTERQRRLANY